MGWATFWRFYDKLIFSPWQGVRVRAEPGAERDLAAVQLPEGEGGEAEEAQEAEAAAENQGVEAQEPLLEKGALLQTLLLEIPVLLFFLQICHPVIM
jgi:hypothetical protein